MPPRRCWAVASPRTASPPAPARSSLSWSVTDNGPAMKSVATARWFAAWPHLSHVRTRHRSPHTNGVVERWFESLKYERLYRCDIISGLELADCVADFINEYNTARPHQALDHQRPLDAYLQDPTPKPTPPRSEQDS